MEKSAKKSSQTLSIEKKAAATAAEAEKAADATAENDAVAEQKPSTKKKATAKSASKKKAAKAKTAPEEAEQPADATAENDAVAEHKPTAKKKAPSKAAAKKPKVEKSSVNAGAVVAASDKEAAQTASAAKKHHKKSGSKQVDDAVLCPACGKALLPADQFCIYCGADVSRKKETDTEPASGSDIPSADSAAPAPDAPVKPRPKWMLPLVLLIAALLVAAAITLPIYFDEEHSTYREAKSAFNAGEYEDSYALFSSIEDFKDSAQMMNESRYMQADSAFAQEDYEAAREVFSELDGYKDSSERVSACSYALAEKNCENEEWFDAYLRFMEIQDYKDSRKRALECVRSLIRIASNVNDDYTEKQAGEALALLLGITGDSDASALIDDAEEDLNCTLAKQKYAAGDARTALNILADCTSVRAQKLYSEIAAAYYNGSYISPYYYYGYGAAGWYSVTAQPNLRVRSGPGTNYSVIGKLNYGSSVAVEAVTSGWGRIYHNGQIGWISMDYVAWAW